MTPKVSVIVPVYNVESYLKECIESIRQQTLQDIEIILVDDHSPDNCPNICDQYTQIDTRIKVIHKAINEGLGFARNSGLEIATGEFIAFVDSDDFIDHEMYETLYKKAIDNKCDIVYCSLSFYQDKNSITNREEEKKERIFISDEDRKEFMLNFIAPTPSYKSDVKYMMSVCKAIYKRDLLNAYQIRFKSEREVLSEDLFFNLEMIQHSHIILFLPFYFYFYRINQNSLSHSFSIEKYLNCKIFFSQLLLYLESVLERKEYITRFYRLEFLYLRTFLVASLKNKDRNAALSLCDQIIKDKQWQTLLQEYPFHKLPIKHRFVFKLIKKRKILLLYLISKIS